MKSDNARENFCFTTMQAAHCKYHDAVLEKLRKDGKKKQTSKT